MQTGLTTLQYSILTKLLTTNSPITSSVLGDEFDTSCEVIRYNMISVREWLESRGVYLTSRPNYGYEIDIPNKDRKKILGALEKATIENNLKPFDRNKLLTFELLYSIQRHSLNYYADLLNVCRSTLIRDLKEIEPWLQEHRLLLDKRQAVGTKVVGEEIDIRHALISLILDVVPDVLILKLCMEGTKPELPKLSYFQALHSKILGKVDALDLIDAWSIVGEIEKKLNRSIADKNYIFLVLYWAIMIYRSQAGLLTKMSKEKKQTIKRRDELRVVSGVAERYIRPSDYPLPEAEIIQFTAELISSQESAYARLKRTDVPYGNKDDLAPKFVHRFTEKIVDEIDWQLPNPIVLHQMEEYISRTLQRMEYGLPTNNPFTDEVKYCYPDIWNKVEKSIKETAPPLTQLGQDSIATLTMYIVLASQLDQKEKEKKKPKVVVACPSGGVSVWLLVSRLNTEFPALEIVHTVSLRELFKLNLSQIDAIITTAPNVDIMNVPTIEVSPVLSNEDIKRIDSYFGPAGLWHHR